MAILDADKEGFLRSETSLIQTIGRAARNADGEVIMYADEITGAMKRAIAETERRRRIQTEYNEKNGIVPKTVIKAVRDLIEATAKVPKSDKKQSKKDVQKLIIQLTKDMKKAAAMLDFELAATLRDKIKELNDYGSK